MTTEVACPACDGRLLVETPEMVVACPHCGAHLTVPDGPLSERSDERRDTREDKAHGPRPVGSAEAHESGSDFSSLVSHLSSPSDSDDAPTVIAREPPQERDRLDLDQSV
ncbi:MAG: hypothetical protein ACREJB_00985, partial [Planctomycetaceae bacterium]